MGSVSEGQVIVSGVPLGLCVEVEGGGRYLALGLPVTPFEKQV